MRKRTMFAALSTFGLVAGLLALSPTAALADTSLTANATDDVTVNAANPNTVIGGTLLRMDAAAATQRQTLMKFTVAGVPAGDQIASATLRVTNADQPTANVLVNSTTSGWSETTATWNNKPAVGALLSQGPLNAGGGVTTDYDVTSAVTGNGTVSFVLSTNNTLGTVLTIGARDNVAAGLHPQLLIKTKTPAKPFWGSSVEQRNGQTKPQALAREESTMGKGAIRVYGQAPLFPTDYGPLADRTLVYSFKGSNPSGILAGNEDAAFRQFLTDAKNYVSDPANPTAKVYWSYYHEPEDNIASGSFTAADYRAAWGHLIAISNEPAFVNVPRIQSTLILMKYTLQSGSGRNFDDYYNAGVDVLGFDTYKWEPTTSISSMIDPIVAVAAAHGKPWAVAETGVSVHHTDAQRQQALHDLSAYMVTRSAKPQYVTYFNSDPGGPSTWNWPIDDEPVMANAWISGQDGV